MAVIKGKARQTTSVDRAAEGAENYFKLLRDGTLTTSGFMTALALEGRAFVASFGTLTTPLTFTATAVADITKPAAFIVVPSTVAIIPVHISVYFEAYGTNAQSEVNARLGTGGSYTSGGNAVTPANMLASNPRASLCTCYSGDNTVVTVGSTTNVAEFWRDGQQFAITKTTASATAAVSDPIKFVWNLKDTDCPPVGYGTAGCQLAVHQGSQAGTGFVKVVWVELPAGAVS